jgi:hypothetical protein
MSSISAGITTGTALVSTGDTTGQLVLKTNGTTTAVTIGTDQVVTLAQPLPASSGGTGATSTSGAFAAIAPAPGTAGNLLTSNGTAWTSAAPAGGGSWVLISSIVASGSSTVDFTSGIDSTYKTYAVIGSGLTLSGTAEQPLYARVRTAGTFKTANYGQALNRLDTNSSGAPTNTNSTEDAVGIILATRVSALAAAGSGFTMYFSNPSSTTQRKAFYGQSFINSEDNYVSQLGVFGGVHTIGTAAVDGLRFVAVGGTLSGTFSLYGIKTS